jgi:DNA-binding XRE family transcriptional regulator
LGKVDKCWKNRVMTLETRFFAEQPKVVRDPDQCMLGGAYVCAVRNALGMSQGDLAAILGVTRTTLTRLEQGLPPLKMALCKTALEVFKEAGVSSMAMDDAALIGVGLPVALDIKLEIHHLRKMRSQTAKAATAADKATMLT